MCCWPTQYIVDIRSYCSPAQWAVFVQGMVFICKVFLTYKVCCLLARFVAVDLTVRYGADLQYVLLTYMVFCWHKVTWKVCCLLTRHSVYLQSVARCLPAKCVGYRAKCLGCLHGTAFTCKVSWLPTRHDVYLQSVLFTYKAQCLLAKCAAYLTYMAWCLPAKCVVYLHVTVFTCKVCWLPTRHGVYLQSVLFTYKAQCLPAKSVVYLHGTVLTCKVCCLPTPHGVYLQSVLFTYKAWCLPAVCACLWPDPPLVASALLSWLSAPWLSLLAFHLHLLLTLRSPQSRPLSVTQSVEKNPADNLLACLYKHDLTCHSPQSFPLFSVAGYRGRKH